MIEKNLNKSLEIPIRAFAQEQRESDVGILLNFFYLLYKLIRVGGFLFFIFFLILRKAVDSVFYALSLGGLLTVLFLLSVLLIAYLKYIKLLYHIDYERAEFHIKKGVFHKTHLVFKLERIQQVYVKRSWLQRLLGLSSLEIETAGSPEKEVSLKALSVNTAQELMQVLMQAESKKEKFCEIGNNSEELNNDIKSESITTKISLKNILKFGLSENIFQGILLILIPVNYIYQNFSTLFSEKVAHLEGYTKTLSVFYLFFFIVVLLISGLIFNMIKAVFKFYGYQFYQKEEELKMNFGLTNLKSISLRPLRIQLISIHQNILQKYLSITNYKIYPFGGAKGKDTIILVPGLKATQQELLNQYIELPDFKLPLQIVKPFMRLFYVHTFFHFSLLLLLTGIVSMKFNPFPFIVIAISLVPIVTFWNYQAYKLYRLEVYSEYLVKKSGYWKKKKLILNIHKIQSISIKQYFWQKRLNMGKITFATAGGNFDFKFADKQVLQNIQNKCLYSIEAFPQKWM